MIIRGLTVYVHFCRPASEENLNTENTVLLLTVFNRNTKMCYIIT